MQKVANILLIAAVVGIILPFTASYFSNSSEGLLHSIPWMAVVVFMGVLGLSLHIIFALQNRQRISLGSTILLLSIAGLLLGALLHSQNHELAQLVLAAALVLLLFWIFIPNRKQ